MSAWSWVWLAFFLSILLGGIGLLLWDRREGYIPPRYLFEEWMAEKYLTYGFPDRDQALTHARYILDTILAEEGIEYGDPGYAWTEEEAHTLVWEWDVSYWEEG